MSSLPKSQSRRRFLRYLLGGAAAVGLGGAVTSLLRLGGGRRGAGGPPVVGMSEDNLAAHRRVDPALKTHRAAGVIRTGLDRPSAIALDEQDRLYVAGEGVVRALEADGSRRMDMPVDGRATCVGVGLDGLVYVGVDRHVEVLDPATGQRRARWEAAPRNHPRAHLTSIAASRDGVYVADFGNRVVWRFDLAGKLLGRIESDAHGVGGTGFVVPSPFFDLALGSEGTLWVANPGQHRVESYRGDGTPMDSWGHYALGLEGFCGCCNPSYFALWPAAAPGGYGFVTSEKGLPRIKVYDRLGALAGVVAAPEEFEPEAKGLDVAVDRRGRVLVLEPQAGVVRVFEPV